MEKSSKILDRMHQEEVFNLAASNQSIHLSFLSWKTLWFYLNQISAGNALIVLTQINLGPSLRAGPLKIWQTFSPKASPNIQFTFK